MHRMAVDPEQHPVDQYRYGAEWSEIMQYLALLYLHSKTPYYKQVGRASAFNTAMNRYRDLELYSHEFYRFLEEVLDPAEYTKVRGLIENAHGSIKSRLFKPVFLRQAFRGLKDDLPHVHSPRIKSLLAPLIEYFKGGAVHALDVESQAIAAMRKIRNPRIRRVLETVAADLPNMTTEPELKATREQIDTMGRVEMATLARDTKDDDTLVKLLEMAVDKNERTVLAVLFQRGYVKGSAPRVFIQSKLVTLGGFKRLRDDVLYAYLRDMPWEWQQKFRGRSVWKGIWQEVVGVRDALLFRMAEDVVGGTFSPTESTEFYKVAANTIPVSKITPDMIGIFWKYAEDPDPMVRQLPKADRIAQYRKNHDTLSPNVWLFDLDKNEVMEFVRASQIDDSNFLAQHLGAGWGYMLNPNSDLDQPRKVAEVKIFFSNLGHDDVRLLQEVTGFSGRVTYAIEDGYSIKNRYPGGQYKYFSDIFDAASKPAKAYLMSIVSSSFIEHVKDRVENDEELVADAEKILQSSRDLDKKWVDDWKASNGPLESASPNSWNKILKKMHPSEMFVMYKLWKTGGKYHYNWDVEETYLAKNLPPDDLLELLDDLRANSHYHKDIIKAALKRMPASNSLQLVRHENEQVRQWVADNYPNTHLVQLLQNPVYFEYVCRFADRARDEDVATLVQKLNTEWPKDLSDGFKTDALKCLVKRMDHSTDGYLTHEDPKVRSEAVVKASPESLKDALKTSRIAIFGRTVDREDFAERGEEYVEAFLANPKIKEDYLPERWPKDLTRMDYAVSRMTDDQFIRLINAVHALLAQHSPNPSFKELAKPWSIYAYQRFTEMGADEGIGRVLQEDFKLEGRLWSQPKLLKKAFSPEILYDLSVSGPWDDTNTALVRKVASLHSDNEHWLHVMPDDLVNRFKNDSHLNWRAQSNYDEEWDRRLEAKKVEARGSLLDNVNAYNEQGDYVAIAKLFDTAIKSTVRGEAEGAKELLKNIYMKTKEQNLKEQIIAHASTDLLDELRRNNVLAKTLVVLHAPEDYLKDRFGLLIHDHMEIWARQYERDPIEGARKDTRIKAALIHRAKPAQALDMFKFYYKQKRFGPKVREAFLEKLNDAAFKKVLVKFLLSKEFTLRIKNFTLEMLPVVLKLDDPALNEKFNRSRIFREKAIGGLVPYWEGLSTRKDKEDFLDGLNDRVMLERLLRGLVELDVSLKAPMNEEFVLGSNNTLKTQGIMARFQQSTTTTTHAELFNLSVEHASQAEIQQWILTNPLLVFDYSKAAVDTTAKDTRVDWISDAENTRVEKAFKDTWDKQTHASFNGKVNRVYSVVTPRKSVGGGKKLTLYHGTDFFATGCIIQGGFKIMNAAKAGRMLGDGIYFSDVASKVMQYIGARFSRGDDAGVVLVCEVDMGNMLELTGTNNHLQRSWYRAPNDYDSVYWPKRGSRGSYGGYNSEYCVRDVSRIKILYIMEVVKSSRY